MLKHLKNHTQNSGFTLIELMLTIVIAAILLGIGIPSFSNFILSQRVRNASFDVISMLSLARSEAIKRNTNVSVTQETGGWQNGWTITSGTTVLGKEAAFSHMSITSAASTLTYNNGGRLAGTAGVTFEVSAGTNTRCVTVDLSGMPISKNGSC